MNIEIANLENWKEQSASPSNFFVWTYCYERIYSSLCEEIVSLALCAEDIRDLQQFDFDYVSQVADHVDLYIQKAFDGIKAELVKNPDLFGIKPEQVSIYLKNSNKDFRVSIPVFMISPKNEIDLQFIEANFPNVEYGHGIMVHFENDTVKSVEVVGSDEEILKKLDSGSV